MFNVELKYAVAGESVSVIKTINDAEVGKMFSEGVSVGDTVSLLVDMEKPKRFELEFMCISGED